MVEGKCGRSCCRPSGSIEGPDGEDVKCGGAEGPSGAAPALEAASSVMGFSLAGVLRPTGSGLGGGGCCGGGAMGAIGGDGVVGVGTQLMGDGATCAGAALLPVVAADTPAPNFGSAEKSCFRTEEGVGVLVGAVLVGEVVEAVGAGVLDVDGEGCSAWAGTELAGREAEFPLCFGELLALPGLTGRTGNGPHVLGDDGKVPPNCAIGRRG